MCFLKNVFWLGLKKEVANRLQERLQTRNHQEYSLQAPTTLSPQPLQVFIFVRKGGGRGGEGEGRGGEGRGGEGRGEVQRCRKFFASQECKFRDSPDRPLFVGPRSA